MNLECKVGEDPERQCDVIEDGVRCNRGVKVVMKKIGVCTKHYGRYRRNGNFIDYRTINTVNRLKRVEKEMLSKHRSIICVCTHRYHLHSDKIKTAIRCTIDGCLCHDFAGADMFAVQSIVKRMDRLGFVPMNNTAICLRCKQTVNCGPWHDGHIFHRLVDHLKTHQVRRSELSSYSLSG